MIFGIKEKEIILTHTIYFWLLRKMWFVNFCGPGSHKISSFKASLKGKRVQYVMEKNSKIVAEY